MAERGIEVVSPEQVHHPAAEPDAFRISGRAADLGGSFRKFIGAALRILGGIAGLAGLRRLVAGLGVVGLRQRGKRRQQQNRRSKCNGQNTRKKGT